jgi:hypothetical protein
LLRYLEKRISAVKYKILAAIVAVVGAFGLNQAIADETLKDAQKAVPALLEELAKYQTAEKTTADNL